MRSLAYVFILILLFTTVTSFGNADVEVMCRRDTTDFPLVTDVLKVCQKNVQKECSDIPAEKRMKCEESLNPDIYRLRINNRLGCVMGALKATGDFFTFLYDVGKFLLETAFKAAASGTELTAEAIRDPSGLIARTGDRARRMTQAQLMSVSQLSSYIKREYEVQSRRVGRLEAIPAVMEQIFAPVFKTVLNSVERLVTEQIHKFDCYDEKRKGEMICRTIGQFLIPPAGVFTLLKGGTLALKNFPKIKEGLVTIEKMIEADRTLAISLKNQNLDPRLADVLNNDKAILQEVLKNEDSIKNLGLTVSEQQVLARNLVTDPQVRSAFLSGISRMNDPKLALAEKKSLKDSLKLEASTASVALSAAATKQLMETEKRIKNVLFFSDEAFDKETLSLITDEKLRAGFKLGLEKMQNADFIAQYFRKLQTETFEKMLSSGNTDIIKKANSGILDKGVMEQVLLERAKKQGLEVVTIQKILSDEEFNKTIGKGFIIDNIFSAKQLHGNYTHFLQQDMSYQVIAEASGKSMKEVSSYFGTPEGLEIWKRIFDKLQGTGRSPFSPEFFKPNFMTPNIPLTKNCSQRTDDFYPA